MVSLLSKFGAKDGARTRDIRDHNPTLYLLSYFRRASHMR